MKRKFFHRILPILMAVLMVIGTLPADFGFSAEAYASGDMTDPGNGGTPSEPTTQAVTFTVNSVDFKAVDDVPLGLYAEITENGSSAAIKVDLSQTNGVYTGTTSEPLTVGTTYSYTIKSDSYVINADSSSLTGTITPTADSSTVAITATGWTFTPNFNRATSLTLSTDQNSGSAEWGTKITLTAHATSNSESGKSVENQTVTFYANNQKIGTDTTDADGKATYEWTATAGGNYTLKAVSEPSGGYAGTSSSETLYTLLSQSSTLQIEIPGSEPWNQQVKIKAKLTDKNGNGIPKQTISFNIGGSTQTATTDENGYATIPYTPGYEQNVKAVSVTASFAGNESYKESTDNNGDPYTATAVKPVLSLNAEPGKGSEGSWQKPVELTGTLTYTNGTENVPVSGAEIIFTVSDGTELKGTTGTDGKAAVTWTPASAADVTITVSYAGNGQEFSAADDASISDYSPALATPKLSAEVSEPDSWKNAVTITGTLVDENGSAINGAELIFSDGTKEIGRATTYADGKASITWNPKNAENVNITVSYSGKTDYYNSVDSAPISYTPELETQSFTVSDSSGETVSNNDEQELSYGKNTAEYTLTPVNDETTDKNYEPVSKDFTVEVDDTNIVTAVIESGKLTITPVNVGTAKVTITQKEKENYYAESKQTITFTVLPYELNLVTENPVTTQGNASKGGASETAWNNDKVYDATNIVDARAKLDLSQDVFNDLTPDQAEALKKIFYDGKFSEDQSTYAYQDKLTGEFYLLREGAEANDADGNPVIHVSDSQNSFNVTFTLPTTEYNSEEYQNFVFAGEDGKTSPSIAETAQINILQRGLTLTLSDKFERQFNTSNYNDEGQPNVILPKDVITEVTGFPASADTDEEAKTIKDAICALEAGWDYLSIDDSVIGIDTPKGQHQNAIYMTDDQLDSFNKEVLSKTSGDYIFNGVNKGTVIITDEQIQNFTQYISLNSAASTNTYQNGDTIYYGEDAKAVFNTVSPYNTLYRVELDSNGDVTSRILIDTANPQTFAGDSVETYTYYLANVVDDVVVGQTAPFEITFYRDIKMPTAKVTIDQADSAVTKFGQYITFSFYKNESFDVNINVYDEEAQDQTDYASGVFSVGYQIVNFKEDFQFDGEGTIIDDVVFEKISEEPFEAILDSNSDGIFTKQILINEDPEQIGNYVVFVRVQDNVGNAMIYGSNGMIFENIPVTDVTINFDQDTSASATNYKGTDHFANGESVTLSITANENSEKDVWSGIHKIAYTVTSESSNGVDYTAGIADNDRKEGVEYTIDPENEIFMQTPPQEITLADLKAKYSSLTGMLNDIYTTQDQSQIVTVTASATDFAGNGTSVGENESAQVSRTFVIDPVAPVISDTLTSGAQVQNGKYYNQDVVITTKITERFLDMENKLIYTINGTTMTLGELLSRKAEFGISSIVVEYGADGSVGEERSDDSTSTVTITFHDDGEYTISAQVSDYAGNQSAPTQTDTFVVDQTKPVASVAYYSYGTGQTFAPGTAANAPYYLNQNYSSFKAVVSVTELNFEKDGNVNTNLTIGATNSENKTTDEMTSFINTHGANVKSAQNWSDPSGITRTYTVDVTADANYSFDFNYTDLAGNELEVAVPTAYVTLDRVVPSGEIIVNGFVNGVDGNNNATQKSWFEKFISAITFNLFGKDSVNASMKSSDVTSGMASTQYIATSTLLSKAQLAARTDWRDYTGNIHLAANENVIVYEKVTDRAGNTEYYSTENIVVDNVDPAPEVTITPSAPAWGKGVYAAGDHPGFDISVTDPSVNNAYSGLKEITYQIVNGTTGHTETGTLATFNRNEHTQNWTGHVSIDPEAFYSNDVQITVSASDWSTNEATSETQTLKVDNKNPIVTFSFSTADVLNGKYYKNNKTLTITVDERNFDPSYTPTVTSSSGGGYSFSGWSSNGEIHTGVVTFSGDSDYTVTFDCYDLAGNHSNTENLAEFTVDKTLPTVSVSYNNNDVLNGHYYSDTRTATVTITEHNFRASDARATITAALNGAGISAPSISGWSTSGDRHTATVSFNSDGDYTFDIAYTDLAGNAMADYAQDSFTVDLTNPEIEITGVENRSANKGTVAPVITLTDTNYTANGVTLTLTGADKGRINVDAMVSRSAVTNGQTITFRNFGENMDDIYTLTAKLVDQAGNETTRSINFSVNRDGSTYKLNDYTAQLVQSGFTNSPKDIVIQEVNVDTLEFIEITYTKDGEVVTLKEGIDYTVEEEGGDGQWKVYTYTIKASCFEEEGQYSINIYSEDRAKNTSTYQAKNSKLDEEEQMTLEFVVDKTAPSVSIANLEDRGRYRENVHEFTLSVKDNMLLSYVELYLDGVLYHTYSSDELTVEDGVLTIPVDSKNAYQTVKIIAYDAAGNPTDPVEYQVLVTSNWWIQFYMNKPLFFGCIAGIVVIAGVIIFLVVKRSKKDNKNYKKI